MKKRWLGTLVAMSLLWVGQAFALNFVATQIRVVGLKRVPRQTVMSYLPIKPGDHITPQSSNNVINKLYKTGFFKNISLGQSGSTLIIHVVERPVISRLTISGNKVIPTKALKKVLKHLNVSQGYEYNRSVIKEIKMALTDQYYSHGKYNASVNISVTRRKNNTVAVNINISEGLTAVIKQIRVIGNHKFTEKEVLGQFTLSTPGLFSFMSSDDQYSSDKLASDLDHLKSFYLNNGYLKMKIDSSQVSLTPDRKHVYIIVKITEGDQYKFAGYNVTGRLIVPKKTLDSLVTIQKGQVYSKQAIIDSEQALGDKLGYSGYAWALVKPRSTLNKKNKTIFVNFRVVPGRRVYVRRILFTGNTHTNDSAFRRELMQMEGSLVSTQSIKNSKQNLLQLPFVKNAEVTSKHVPGTNNEEDLFYNITTAPSGTVQAGVGYSDVDGFLVNAALTQQNFFGTGNSFGMNLSYSASMLSAGINYFNPYYTPWGVGRGFSLYAQHYNASNANIADYTTDDYGAAVNYSIPLARFDSLQFGFGIDYLHLMLGGSPANIMRNFRRRHGSEFLQVPVNFGWAHNSLNRAIFPTRGLMQALGISVSVPVQSKSLEYYKATYDLVYFHPIYQSFVGKLTGNAGYGAGYGAYKRLPFFKNFYMGGMSTVRGYEANSIGPRDSKNDAIGGNLMLDATASLIFPNPFSKTLRTSVFFDAGNVYDTKATRAQEANNKDRDGLRYSAGIGFDWLSPMGMLNFSLAHALNPNKHDDTTIFQFNIGTTI